jgi:glutathione S-transferase
MKLYYCDLLNPWKACAVARYLGSPVEFIYVAVDKGEQSTPDYLAINPNGTVPALTDGDRCVWESNAIMCYLANKAGSELWPHDDRQIDIVRWLSWDACHFSRHGGALYFEYVIKPRFGAGDPDPVEVEQALGSFRKFAHVLDDHLRGRTCLVGEHLTVADFAVAVALPYADQARIPLAEFPNVRRWHDRLNQLDAWRRPFPDIAPSAAAA